MSILSLSRSVFGFYCICVYYLSRDLWSLGKHVNKGTLSIRRQMIVVTNNNSVFLGSACVTRPSRGVWSLATSAAACSVWQGNAPPTPASVIGGCRAWPQPQPSRSPSLHQYTASTLCSQHSLHSAASLSRSHQSQILMIARVRWATAPNLC